MKRFACIITSLLAFILLFTANIQAQRSKAVFNDTMLVFNQNPDIIFDSERLDFFAKPFMINNKLVIFKPVIPGSLGDLQVPKATKTSTKPVVLRHNDQCYLFECVENGECDQCRLVWWDRNGDGNVQPLKELRCVCPGAGKCRIKVTKVHCQ